MDELLAFVLGFALFLLGFRLTYRPPTDDRPRPNEFRVRR